MLSNITIKKKLQVLFFLFAVIPVFMKAQTSTINGAWSNNATWGGVTAPSETVGSGGVVEIATGDTVTLSSKLDVKSNGTLDVYGYLIVTSLDGIVFWNGCNVVIHDGGTLKCETGVTNNNASGITVNGSLICLGNYEAGNGSVMGGTGAIQVQGTLTVQGSADVMGVTNPGCDACNVTVAGGIVDAGIYSEDFSNDEGKGIDGSISNPTDSNWSISEVGNPDHDGNDDHIKVVSGVLTSRDGGGDASNYAVFELAQVSGNYFDVSISFDYGVADGYPSAGTNGSGIIAYYKIDGGSWVEFENFQGSSFDDVNMTNTTLSGLSFSTSLDVKFHIWSRDYSYVYVYLDNIAIYGIQNTTPSISTSGTLSAFSSCSGTNSSNQTFTVQGANMNAGILINPPSGYEVSTTSDFSSNVGTNGSGITVGSSGTIALTTIYVRTTTSASNGDGGNIECSSTGATQVDIATGSASISSDTYYVSTTGSDSNNGITSGTAFATLQKAIDMVSSSCASTTIHVAAGTYTEDGVSISSKSNISIIGAGIGSTTFDGDFGNRFMAITGTSDNISISDMKIMEMDEGTVNGTYSGGGMYITSSGTIDLTSIEFKSCRCDVNGGSGGGGAIYVGSSATVNIYKSLFSNNRNSRTHSSQDGGAICNTGTIHIENSLFYNNPHEYSYGYDGTIVFKGGGDGTIVNSTITYNLANNNGRIPLYVDGSGSTVTILNSILYGYPGGYNIRRISTPTINSINCIGYDGNVWDGTETNCYTTTDFGFADVGSYDFSLSSSSYCKDKGTSSISSPVSLTAPSDDIDGTTRSGNPDVGCYEDNSPTITTSASLSTFSACSGTNSSEQSFTISGSNLTNNIVISPPTGYEISESSGTGFTSSITLTQSGGSVGSTTIYVRTTTSASNGDGGNIECTSTGATQVDIATGSASITSSVYYVATTGSDSNSGLTSGSPFATIQHAIDQINVSCGSAVIYVADGTYDESNIDIDLSLTIIGDSESGTIIDNNDVSGEYCFLVTTDNADVKLQNLTIRDFKGDAGCAFKSYKHDNKIVFDAVTINSCYVNSSSTYDGVVFIYHDTGATSSDSIVIKNSTFSDNTSAEASGGCALDIGSYSYDYDYSVLLENTTFDNNDVTTPGSSYGACMIDRGYSVTVKKCTFSNNNNYYYGSGLYVSYLGSSSGVASRFTLENSLFHDNSASNGGSCTVYNVRGSVFNSTFAQNTSSNASDYYVTGLEVDGVVTAKNCIFQSDDSGNEVIQGYSGDLTISYSLLYGGSGGDSYTDGGNNLSSDPDFTNAGSNDFTLASTSPCIDAGTATGAPSDDIAGTTRDATPDLGCYEAMSNEWTGAVSTAWTNTGNWSLGTVPTSSDAVTIPDVTNQPEITSIVTLAGLTIASGADITISSNSLTVTGTIDLNGTMNIDNATVNADATFDATGGTIDFTNANGKLILSSTVTSLGTLDAAMGTVEYDGATQTVFGDNYYNLEIDVSGTKTADGAINVDGNLSTSATAGCKLDMGTYALNIAGDLTVGATDGLDLSDGSSLVTFDGSSDQTLSHAGNNTGSLGATQSEGFETGSGSWTVDNSGSFDWERKSGSTGSSGTGPSGAYAGSYYYYTEATNGSTGDDDYITQTFNFSSYASPQLTFYYHMYGSDMGTLYVEANTGGGWSVLETISGQQHGSTGASWTLSTVDLSTYAGNSSTQIRFHGERGSGYTSDMAIDAVEISDAGPAPNGSEFNDLTINNSGGNVIFNDEISVDGTITFTSGDIDASSNNLVLTSNATVSGADDDSHVVGTIVKTIASDASHEFPLGNGTVFRKVDIDPNDATSRDWTVTYNDNVYSDVTTTGLLTYVSDTCYWDITPTSTPASTTVKLNWTSAIGINDADLSNIKLAHFNGTDWELISTTTSGVPLAGSVSGNVTSFSPFTIGTTGANPLPVTLTQFEGYAYNEFDNKLEWNTKTEKNADYMEIQHSDDGIYFDVIGIEKLAGNSQNELFYEYIDRSVSKQINYYRLKQFDFDGKSTLTKTISIDNRSSDTKQILRITNLIGQEIDKNYKGVVIIQYSDGTSEKRIQ